MSRRGIYIDRDTEMLLNALVDAGIVDNLSALLQTAIHALAEEHGFVIAPATLVKLDLPPPMQPNLRLVEEA
jgi:hypothetical protein